MKTLLCSVAALLLSCAVVSLAQANPYFPPPCPQAPAACGPGYYQANQCGAVYGPNYCLRPSYPPFNGLLPPCPPRTPPVVGIPTHPYARGPRDYFMLD